MSDLSVSENGSHVEVIWVAPFSLDVTGVEYDITYSILISNVTDETSPMPVACAVCHNLTLTHFTFSPPHPLPGHSFTFTVTPQNGAGSGPPSQSLTATLTDGIIIVLQAICIFYTPNWMHAHARDCTCRKIRMVYDTNVITNYHKL